MADDNNVPKVNPSLIAEIVRSYVAKNHIAVDQIGGVIATVHQTLSGLGTNMSAPAPVTERLTPAVPIRRSVQPEYVVCLECGFRAHLAPPSANHAWLRTDGLSGTVEIGVGSPANGCRLFGAALGDGQTGRARSQPGRGCPGGRWKSDR
jgi:ROS/MUCR transcriptional regulator protein